jgi:YrbI family 3-deoxy-D-manno-octulosonate 8-phosphate phosphatase
MERWQQFEIDTFEDIEICKSMYLKFLKTEYICLPEKIDLIVYDFDGVLTDNKAIIDQDGKEIVTVNRSDGLAIAKIKDFGIPQLILSTEKNNVVLRRAEKLNIPVLNGVENKKEKLIKYISNKQINKNNIIYFGNDINDIDVMEYVGYAIAPRDAYIEVQEIAEYITEKKGGEGVIREFYNNLKYKEKYNG